MGLQKEKALMFFRWLRSMRRGLGLTESTLRRGRGASARRLQLECLEERTMPATATTLSPLALPGDTQLR